MKKYMKLIEKVIKLLYLLIMAVLFVTLFYATVERGILIGRIIYNNTLIFDFSVESVDLDHLFLQHVQSFIAGILLLIIIIELIKSFFVFLKAAEYSRYLIILYEIAMIAIVRHLFTMDLEHIDGKKL